MVNKRYEFYKWLSDTIKTLSWGASGMMAYFSLGTTSSIHSILAIAWYFGGLQILAFKLNLRALEEKEGE